VLRNPKPAGRKVWMVIGKPSVIDKVEPIIDNIKDRIIYRKKLSYACLVLLLRN
jgi:hypothetical protein